MIDARNLHLAFGDRALFDDISFQLGDQEKVCLAGANGSGKTTLLKMLCGELQPDSGSIVRSRSVKIGYLRQHLGEENGATVYEAALDAFREALDSAREREALHVALEHGGLDEERAARLDFLEDELVRTGYYTAESETRKVLAGLGFDLDRQNAPLASLSGGWRMRVALARVLLSRPTCLFLDEPTNHLDLESIVWLEGYIRNYSGCLALISHDRQFVDRTCDRIMELQGGAMMYYPLPYSRYESEKTVRAEQILREHKKQQDEIRSLERFVERFKAKASKATQAQSKQKQLDRIERIELPASAASIRLRFHEAPPSGQWVFEAEDLVKRYGDLEVFRDGKFSVRAGDKLVIVGPNGAGKTTLLKLLLGLETPTGGTIVTGSGVQIGYFAQYEEPTPQEAETNLVDYLAAAHPKLPTQQIRSILGGMLFSDDDAFKKFGVLSGGERSRVRLCRLLLQRCNILILDEPTNHLDMDSKHLLMQALSDFGGTVLFVSHDRHFVANVATRVLQVRGGKVSDYPGDYAYYCRVLQAEKQNEKANEGQNGSSDGRQNGKPHERGGESGSAREPVSAVATASGESHKAGSRAEREARKEADRRKRKAEKRQSEIETEITALDQKIVSLDAVLSLPETYADSARWTSLAGDKKKAEENLAKLYREMEALEKTPQSPEIPEYAG